LLVGVLLTLCVSEGVGLQLLPLPSKGEHSLAECPQLRSGAGCTHTPSHSEYIPGRVEIAAPKLEKRSLQQQFEQVVTAALSTARYVEAGPLQVAYAQRSPSVYSFTFVSRPAARAPPRLA